MERLSHHHAVAQREHERVEADRLYNDALTDVDRALPEPPAIPALPTGFDEQRLPTLNELWTILAEPPPTRGRGLRSRLAHFVWQLVAPALERQQSFNSVLIDHLNRNVEFHRRTAASINETIEAQAESIAALTRFHAQLIRYFQQITLYVDSKDRAVAAGLRAVIDAVADEFLRGTQSLRVREQRLEDVRDTIATLQQRTLTIKREFERFLASPPVATSPSAAAAIAAETAPAQALDSYKYLGFEDLFRGSQAEVRQRQIAYLDDFRGAQDVLDVGCGRGEFLDLLRDAGVRARGLDVNHEMVEMCKSRGLDAIEADALGHLGSLPDGSLGGLFSAQVVEHLTANYLMRLLETAYHKLRPGSRIVLETINPSCWIAFFESYVRDPTHVHPVHPETLKYLLQASGFHQVEIRYRAPYPDVDKLQPASTPEQAESGLRAFVDIHNANVRRLNALMFSYWDFAAVGVRS